MNKAERIDSHQVMGTWMPNPEAHLDCSRDRFHYEWTLNTLGCYPYEETAYYTPSHDYHSILDVGAFDGWLDFLLIEKGFCVEGVEIIPNLCASARNYAKTKEVDYKIHEGFFDEVAIPKRFDVVLSYETLEHIPLELVGPYISKMESIATRRILISLPDQKKEDNPQHLWSPSYPLILEIFGDKKNFQLTYKPYHGTWIPANFLLSWDI